MRSSMLASLTFMTAVCALTQAGVRIQWTLLINFYFLYHPQNMNCQIVITKYRNTHVCLCARMPEREHVRPHEHYNSTQETNDLHSLKILWWSDFIWLRYWGVLPGNTFGDRKTDGQTLFQLNKDIKLNVFLLYILHFLQSLAIYYLHIYPLSLNIWITFLLVISGMKGHAGDWAELILLFIWPQFYFRHKNKEDYQY